MNNLTIELKQENSRSDSSAEPRKSGTCAGFSSQRSGQKRHNIVWFCGELTITLHLCLHAAFWATLITTADSHSALLVCCRWPEWHTSHCCMLSCHSWSSSASLCRDHSSSSSRWPNSHRLARAAPPVAAAAAAAQQPPAASPPPTAPQQPESSSLQEQASPQTGSAVRGAGRVLRALCHYSPQDLSDGPASLSKVRRSSNHQPVQPPSRPSPTKPIHPANASPYRSVHTMLQRWRAPCSTPPSSCTRWTCSSSQTSQAHWQQQGTTTPPSCSSWATQQQHG